MTVPRPLPVAPSVAGPARHVATTSWAAAGDTPAFTVAWRRRQDRRRLRAIAGRAERLTVGDLVRFLHARFLAR